MKVFFKIVALAQIIVPCMCTLSVTLAPGEEFCLAFRTPKTGATHISGSFDVMNDDLTADPVTAVLFDYETEKVIWHSVYGEGQGSFSTTNAGKFHYCFGNGAGGYKLNEEEKSSMHLHGHPVQDDAFDYTNSDGELRTIGFTLRLRPVEGTEAARLQKEKSKSDNAADEQQNKLIDMTMALRDEMELLLDHQEYIKKRESDHRHIVEQTFSMVRKWTILEAIVLVTVAFGQVTYLKRFFETKRFL